MKDGLIICGAILAALCIIAVVVMIIAAIFPFLVAIGFIILIYWMVAKCLTGGFSPWRK